jgi:predicted MFS family arabinose efflux permease
MSVRGMAIDALDPSPCGGRPVSKVRTPFKRSYLIVFSLSRFIINTAFRMVYPFLPTLARGVGVSFETIASAVTVRSSLGIAAPLIGPIADRRGRKVGMLVGLMLFVAGMGMMAIWRSYAALFISLLLVAMCKIVFDPAMQSYLGDHIDYKRRGLAIGLTEFGWSGAFLIGMPFVAWIIFRADWYAPFPILAALGLALLFVLWWMLPSDRVAHSDGPSFVTAVRTVLAHPSALAALGAGLLISSAYDTIAIVLGAWLEQSFGLQVIALGAASALIGIAELGGEGLVAGFSDRIGKRRTVALGIGLAAITCIFLPLMSNTLAGALTALVLIYIGFEVAIVSAIPMMTELVPGARATFMAGNVAVLSLGRAVGASLGPALFSIGIWANSLTATILALGSMAILLLFVHVE